MERINYIDTLKGYLILLVVAHHIPYYALSVYKCHNEAFSDFMFLREFLYMPYFMTAFFVCSGICSNFDKSFADFAKGVAKIAIPSYLLLRHTQWFIDAFILSKLIYWLVNKYVRNAYLKFAVVLLMAVAGCVLHGDKFYYEAFAWHHALEMVFFIYLGHHWKSILLNTKYISMASVAYVVLALACFFCFGDIPYFEKVFHVSYVTFVPFVVISVLGVMMSVGIARLIDNSLLRYVGRMSLVFFLMHLVILLHLIPRIKGLVNGADGNTLLSVLVFVLIWLVVSGLCLLTARILNHPNLRWVIGK
ncbi:MAG: hypothetical protein K6F22_05155 [Prevotella sp.]|nr:hypothetical protein [Prevotella sp.]